MSDPAKTAARICELRDSIAWTQDFLDNAIIFKHRLVCPLPAQAALYHLQKELAALEATTPSPPHREER